MNATAPAPTRRRPSGRAVRRHITLNIRLPEPLYMQLKLEAAKRRMSLAAVIREALAAEEVRRL